MPWACCTESPHQVYRNCLKSFPGLSLCLPLFSSSPPLPHHSHHPSAHRSSSQREQATVERVRVATITITISYLSMEEGESSPSSFPFHESSPSLPPSTNIEELLSKCGCMCDQNHRFLFAQMCSAPNFLYQWESSKEIAAGQTGHCHVVRFWTHVS